MMIGLCTCVCSCNKRIILYLLHTGALLAVPPMQLAVVFVPLAGGQAACTVAVEQEEDTQGTQPTVETHWLMMTMTYRYAPADLVPNSIIF